MKYERMLEVASYKFTVVDVEDKPEGLQTFRCPDTGLMIGIYPDGGMATICNGQWDEYTPYEVDCFLDHYRDRSQINPPPVGGKDHYTVRELEILRDFLLQAEKEEPITQPQTEDNPIDILYNLGQEFSRKSVEDMAGMVLILCKRAFDDKRFAENLPVAMFLFCKGVLKSREGMDEIKKLAKQHLEKEDHESTNNTL